MKIINTIYLLLLINLSGVLAQSSEFIFMPGKLNFPSLKAHLTEPAMGLFYYPNTSYLKIDIGSTIDIFSINSYCRKGLDTDRELKSRLTFGADFMAYALGAKVKNKQLPIETLDGYFGFNFAYTIYSEKDFWRGRLKIIHNSSHLVDGLFKDDEKTYNLDSARISYAKDYAELTIANQHLFENFTTNFYWYINYLIVKHPEDQKHFQPGAGVELSSSKILPDLFNKEVNLFAAYEFMLLTLDSSYGCNTVKTGIKFGNWKDPGVILYLSYYSGNNYYTQYYHNRVEYFGFGFSI